MTKGFKSRVTRKYIGTYRPKIDGWEKASGRAKYVDDLTLKSKFPGMLYAKVLRSPHPHAKIKRVDTSKAEALPGVKAVITYRDPEVASLRPTHQAWTDGADPPTTYDRMWWPKYRDRRVLSDHVCWVGDEAGVAVAAESEEIAEEALKLIEVEWEALPFVLDLEEAMKPGAPIIHPEIVPDSNVLPPDPSGGPDVVVERGDVEREFAKADVVVEARTRYHNPTHALMENWCCLVEWNDDKLTVWSNAYEAHQTSMHFSEMLGVPLNKVRAICPYIGAQMGRADEGEQMFFLFTALLAKKTGRPVKFKHSRREAFHNTRTAQLGYCKIGAKKDGTITAIHLRLTGDSGAYMGHTMASLKITQPTYIQSCLFNVLSLKLEAYAVYTNKVPSGIMRGIGHVQTNFIMGLAIDMLAEKLGMDPIELVLKNFGWAPLPNKSLESVLREGAKRIGWERRRKPGEGPTYEGAKRRGIGFSFHNNWHASWQELRRGPVQVVVRVNCDGTVNLEAPTVETGTGSNTCCVLACAEALGVNAKDVHWTSTVDTETCVKDQVQTDSAVSHIFPEIIHIAALDAKRQLLELAAPELGVTPEELEIEDGRIYIKSAPKKGILLKDLLSGRGLGPILSSASKTLPSEITGVPYVAAFVEVEVDTETGQVKVLKMVVVHDLGTVMFPSGAEGQQVGGQCLSLGETLTEEIIYDEETGIPLNFNLINYKVPMMPDFPDIEPVIMEVWKGAGEYGACGMGESVLSCTPRAVANAVYNAIGLRIDDLPITPDKVLKALGKI